MSAELCRRCQGACCKTIPGPTTPEQWGAPDRDRMRVTLTQGIESGLFFIDGQAGEWRDLYWTVRPTMTPEGCVFLSSSGCTLTHDQRPTACQTLIPSENFPAGCHQPIEITLNGKRSDMVYWGQQWAPYKSLLQEIVR